MDGDIQPPTLLDSSCPSSGDATYVDQQTSADAFAPLRALLQSDESDVDAQVGPAPHGTGEADCHELEWYRGNAEDSPESEAEAEEEAGAGLAGDASSAAPELTSLPLTDQSNQANKKVKKDKKEKKQKKNSGKGDKKEKKKNREAADAPTPCPVPDIPVPVPVIPVLVPRSHGEDRYMEGAPPLQVPSAPSTVGPVGELTQAAPAGDPARVGTPEASLPLEVPVALPAAETLAASATFAENPTASVTTAAANGVNRKSKKDRTEKKERKAEKMAKKEKKLKKALSHLQEEIPNNGGAAGKKSIGDDQLASGGSALSMQAKRLRTPDDETVALASAKAAKIAALKERLAAHKQKAEAESKVQTAPKVRAESAAKAGSKAVAEPKGVAEPKAASEPKASATGDELVFAGGLRNADLPLAGDAKESSAQPAEAEVADCTTAPEGMHAQIVRAPQKASVHDAPAEDVPAPQEASVDDALAEHVPAEEAIAEEAEPSELIFAGGLRNVQLPEDILMADNAPETEDTPGAADDSTDGGPEVIDVDSDDSPTAEDASALFEALTGASASGPIVEVLKSDKERGARKAAAKLVPEIDPGSSEQGSLQGNASMLDDYSSPLDNLVSEAPPGVEQLQAAEATPAEPSGVIGNASMLDDFAGNASMFDDYDANGAREEESLVRPHGAEVAAAAQIAQNLAGHATPLVGGLLPAVPPASPAAQLNMTAPHASKSCLQAKRTSSGLPLTGPLLQQPLIQPLPLPPPPPPPSPPPMALAMMQPLAAVAQDPILGLKRAAKATALVSGQGVPYVKQLPGALPKSIEACMQGPAPKLARVEGTDPAAVTAAAPATASWQQPHAPGVAPEHLPETSASIAEDALPLQISVGTRPSTSSPADLPTKPADLGDTAVDALQISTGDAVADTVQISVGALDGVLHEPSGDNLVEIVDEDEELEEEAEMEGSMLLEVLQSILPATEDERQQSDGEMQADA